MTAQTRSALKLKFEQGDRPQGSDYEDMIDSFVNTQDSTAQTINSTLVVPKLGATTVTASMVSAQAIAVSGALVTDFQAINAGLTNASAQSVSTSSLAVRGDAAVSGRLTVSGDASVSGAVTVGTLTVVGRLSASSYIAFSINTSVAAISTSQASGQVLSPHQIQMIRTVASGANDAVILRGAYPGVSQQLWNLTTSSGRIFPPSGGVINSAAANASYDMWPRHLHVVTHEASGQYQIARSAM